MTADELAALRAAHCIRVQRYDKNALIYHAGRVVHEIGIVQSGSVNVESNDLWGNKSILSHVEAGQAFAETYALCGEPLMVDVQQNTAAEPCEIMAGSFRTHAAAAKHCRQLVPQVFAQPVTAFYAEKTWLSQRIRSTSKQAGAAGGPTHPVHGKCQALTPKSARGTAADLSFRAGSGGGQSRSAFFHPFDRQQLADYLNLGPQRTFQRFSHTELGKMRDDGLIRCRKNEFELCGTE